MLNFYTFEKRSLSTRSSFFDRARSDFEKREAMWTRILARMKGASEEACEMSQLYKAFEIAFLEAKTLSWEGSTKPAMRESY